MIYLAEQCRAIHHFVGASPQRPGPFEEPLLATSILSVEPDSRASSMQLQGVLAHTPRTGADPPRPPPTRDTARYAVYVRLPRTPSLSAFAARLLILL